MKTETHLKFAEAICRKWLWLATPTERLKFKIGAVLPDFDMLSYLRGFFKKPFFGHNWGNSRRYIMSAAEKSVAGGMGFFELGLFVHYLCDAFTLPHNSGFDGNLSEHTAYEKQLHALFEKRGSCNSDFFDGGVTDLGLTIEKMHRSYEKETKGIYTDERYIKAVTELALVSFLNSLHRDTVRKSVGLATENGK